MTDSSPLNTAGHADPGARPSVFLTGDLPGIGGRLRVRPEDFLVDEIPSYQPCGQGEHLYLLIEKRNMSTLRVVRILARHFGVRLGDVGYAGLKDKRAVTRQVFSVHVPGRRPEDFPQIQHDRIGVLWTDLHTNKLRRGHLAGNRFSIRVRGVEPTAVLTARRVLDRLERAGVPNRIGEQRFGYTGRNHLVGRAIIVGDWQSAADALLAPAPGIDDSQADARARYVRGEYREALEGFSRECRTERTVLGALLRGQDVRRAIRAIDPPEREFYLSAFQSAVFNTVLDRRMAENALGSLVPGDVAFKHDNRALFAVDAGVAADPETAARLARFEISPSGPMWGPTMLRAAGDVDRAECEALAAFEVSLDHLADIEKRWPGAVDGARRPFRVPLTDPDVEGGVDEHGPYVRCAFDLPRGAFATSVMAEIMKNGRSDPPDDDEDDA